MILCHPFGPFVRASERQLGSLDCCLVVGCAEATNGVHHVVNSARCKKRKRGRCESVLFVIDSLMLSLSSFLCSVFYVGDSGRTAPDDEDVVPPSLPPQYVYQYSFSSSNEWVVAALNRKGKLVVVKKFEENLCDTIEMYKRLRRARARHIVFPIRQVQDGCLVFPFAPGRTNCIPHANGRHFRPYFLALMEAVLDMRKAGVAHKDLAPYNIIYDRKSQELRVIDFEARQYKYNHVYNLTPEREGEHDDVWAVGVIFLMSLVGRSVSSQTLRSCEARHLKDKYQGRSALWEIVPYLLHHEKPKRDIAHAYRLLQKHANKRAR